MQAAEDRDDRLAEGQAQRLVEVVRLFLAELGVPSTDSIKAFMADLFRRANDSVIAASPDLAQAARTDLRERIRAELEAERRQLPAGPEMFGSRRGHRGRGRGNARRVG